MPIGSSGVVDYANTTGGEAGGVIAFGGIGGQSVVDQEGTGTPSYIITEAGDRLDTETGSTLIT